MTEDTAFYCAFEELVVRLDHPMLRAEVAPAAREEATHVRMRYVKEGAVWRRQVPRGDSMSSSLTHSRRTVRRRGPT